MPSRTAGRTRTCASSPFPLREPRGDALSTELRQSFVKPVFSVLGAGIPAEP